MRRLWIVAQRLVGLAACGKTTVTAGGTPITYSNSPTSLVVQVEVSGGFVPVETVFTNLPMVSIYGDGSVITSGPQTMIYPGPVVPNLLVRKLDAPGCKRCSPRRKTPDPHSLHQSTTDSHRSQTCPTPS